ncbi:MAG: Hydrogen peroxide-inducible genes activator _ OxyR [uncultured Gemmatimonadaceae bacterium]|uniref:Hydrogen peroxide-inducible genes activator > OxyR n=1 Tax=uncultured Gemmatimonadaceae bacterium TaxID=246130 RepID=A0A6J4KED0_9BACT|nr:MAG: Hydrogen peroxide-inducible genes activator > OxyR [uncultured Gemmatimonadaceae bacterium]
MRDPASARLGAVTLTQLTYAVAVDTHGHFGQAAAACHITQPTLSMQLRKLERGLGVVLFDRSRMPVVATDLGRLLLDQARVILQEAARLPDLRDQSLGHVVGELRVGALPTLAPYLLPRFLQPLTDAHPGLRLVVEELPTAGILDRLRQETLDAGLIATRDPAPGLVQRALFDEPFVGYVHRDHPLAARAALTHADLSLDDVWLLSEAHCLRAQTVQLCQDRTTAPDGVSTCARAVRFESGNLETLKHLVERSGGLTLLPRLALDAAPGAGRGAAVVVPFAAPVPVRAITLVRRRAYLKQHLVDAFVAALLASLPDDLRPPPAAGARAPVPPRARPGLPRVRARDDGR